MVNYADIIANTASEHYNVRGEYKQNTIEQNQQIQRNESLAFSVGVVNVTGELNIGMMLRSACLFGASNFYIFGRKKFDKRSTVGAENYINIVQTVYDNPLNMGEELLADLRSLRCPIILCEQGGTELGTSETKNEYDLAKKLNPLFLFGSESHGMPPEIMAVAGDEFACISVPQRGVLRSFNVAAAMNIVCWDYIKEAL